MPQPRFIQISTLTSYPAALLNRDDSGLAKRMPFGGAVRTRVSSQCLKRHWRVADDPFSLTRIDPTLDLAVRSRALFRKRLLEPLMTEGVPQEVAEAVLLAFQKDLYEGKDKGERKTEGGKSPLDRSEVVVLGQPEIEYLLGQARELCAQAEGDAKEAAKLAKEHLKARKADFHAITCGAGVDGAMFGRFISGDPEARVAAAVHVAHAFSVHPEASETDYFTAVDDLLTSSEGGSGHLGAAELTSGIFYTYVVVDVPLLVSNLTGSAAENWLAEDRAVAGRLVRHLVQLMATVSPGAKLGSTAPYDWAGLVLAEAGERQPRTLANAFLDPIPTEQGNLFGRTVRTLGDYVTAMDAMYGPHEARWLACRTPGEHLPGAAHCSLPELAEALENVIVQAGGGAS